MEQTIHRVLVVDDEPLVREAAARAMSKHGFCCDTASNGREAIECYRKQQHDLVVTDLRMPKYHGHTLILELLKEEEPPHVVVLTGVANTNLVKDLFGRGVEDIIEKPVDFNVFAAKMLSLFERSHWNPGIGQGSQVRGVGAQQTHVQRIEAALEIFSLCIPKSLDQEFTAAAETLSEPPAAMLQFLERLSQKQQAAVDNREYDRIPFLSSAIAIPVNKNFIVKGAPSTVTFNDLSEGGACLYNTRSFPTDYIALRWPSVGLPKRYLKAVMQIKRCKPLGPFYEIAGVFVMHD